MVGEMQILFYEDIEVSPYPTQNIIRYPKAGTPNPSVSVHLYGNRQTIRYSSGEGFFLLYPYSRAHLSPLNISRA